MFLKGNKFKKISFTVILLLCILVMFKMSDILSRIRFFSFKCGIDPFHTDSCFIDSRTHDYRYLILEPKLCDQTKKDVFLLIILLSAPSDFEERATIRETWGSIASHNSNVRLAFILGFRNDSDERKLHLESKTHHDIIQKDFVDSYRNLSLKSESMLHFASIYCTNAKYLLKTDVDMFINVPYVLEILQKMDNSIPMIMGHVIDTKPSQDKQSKWYTPKENFPLTYFPLYVSGTAYIISVSELGSLYDSVLHTKLFWLEDIFITGICRERLGLRLIDHGGFALIKPKVDFCSFSSIVSGHRFSQSELRKVWNEKLSHKECV